MRAELATDKDFLAKDEQEKRLQLLENRKTDLLKERESLQESMDSARMQLKNCWK